MLGTRHADPELTRAACDSPADVKLFEDQGNSDAILDDLACMLGCTRSSLNGGRRAGGGSLARRALQGGMRFGLTQGACA